MFNLGVIAGKIFGYIAIPLLTYLAIGGLVEYLFNAGGFPRVFSDLAGGGVGVFVAGFLIYRKIKSSSKAEIQTATQVTKTGIKVKDYIFGLKTTKGLVKITNPFAGILVVGGPGG